MELSSQNTGVGSLSLLQGIFPTQRSNPGYLYCGQILYQLSHKVKFPISAENNSWCSSVPACSQSLNFDL